MNRLKKFAVAAATGALSLGLWASPAHAYESYSGDLSFTFTDTNGILQECHISADATFDPDLKRLQVTTTDEYEGTSCEVEETTVYISYIDAYDEGQSLLTRARGGYVRVQATGVAKEAVITVVQDFVHCDDATNDVCSDGPTFNAFATAPK